MCEVSIFKNFNQHVEIKPLMSVLNEIKDGRFAEQVNEIRTLVDNQNNDIAKKKKQRLPAFTVACTFSDGITSDKVLNYNSLIILDIDHISIHFIDELKKTLSADPHTLACFVSPSNNGLKVIVQADNRFEQHTAVFNEVKSYYESTTGIEVDPTGSNFNRLCFYSYDPNIYVNQNFKIFNTRIIMLENDIKSVVELVESNGTDITNGYKNWLKIGFALANALGEPGREYFHRISCISSQYNPDDCETQYTKCLKYGGSKTTAKTLFYLAKSNGIDISSIKSFKPTELFDEEPDAQDTKKTAKKAKSNMFVIAESFLSKNYNLRYNVVLGKIEFKPITADKYMPMTDFDENSIFRNLHKNNICISISKLRSVLQSDFCKLYDPFLDYFNSLEKWDEQTDYIDLLSSTVTTTDQKLWQACFKIWFVAVVASLMDPKVVNHTSIIFSGGQGIGKTTWMENLCPPELKGYMFSGTINPNNKDTLSHLSECIFINMDELENMNKSEIGTLKQIITQSNIRLRRSYGHHNESLVRRASFMGSVNTSQFLNDTTGSRRFLCFEVTDIVYNHNVDIRKAFAQAYVMWKNGFRHYFTKDDIEVINTNNEQYQIRTQEEELLLSYFEPIPVEEATLFLPAAQIMARLSARGNTNSTNGSVVTLGKVLKKHNFCRVKRGGVYVWALKELSEDEINRRSSNTH